jgi:hypothetical protein
LPSVPRLWPGGTVACLATGPSLTREDCDALRGHVDGVIAVNDAHRLAPWADVLYSSDRVWWPFYKGVPDFQGLRYGIGATVGSSRAFTHLPSIAVLEHTGVEGLEDAPTGLRSGLNSGYAAINLAVHGGAARILLLGYNVGLVGSRSHFFGAHPRGLTSNPNLYPDFRRCFATLVAPLAARGIEVLNCTPQTALECFPRAELASALRVERLTVPDTDAAWLESRRMVKS